MANINNQNIPFLLYIFSDGFVKILHFELLSHRRILINRILSGVLCIVLAAGAIILRPCHAAAGEMEALSAAISDHLVCYPLELMSVKNQQLSVSSKELCMAVVYLKTGLHPFWVTPEGPGPKASIILNFLREAETEGLDPKNYEVDQISALFTAHQTPALAELDTLLTFNIIKYIHDVSQGQIKPLYTELTFVAKTNDVNFDPLATMEKALNAPDLASYLASLPPAHPHYTNLKKALMTYRAIEKNGGWPSMPAGKTIRPGDHDDRIPAIIHRLSVTNDMDPEMAQTGYYSPLLKQSIVRFQVRNGLTPDGVIGPNTFAAMNVPVSDRIKQIIINMIRWRWQDHDLGEKYVLVNIANFDLTAFENDQESFRIPVIVGKFQHQTPIFSDRIIYIILNPSWNVPPSIAQNEELPKLKVNSHYLKERHIRLFSGWSADAREIDSTSVDWRNVSPTRMRQYKLSQDPGPWNALGKIKFDFPNQYDVYLHDTPTQNLFSQTQRDFSHGCIRVSDPLRLAAFALSRQAGAWTPEMISSLIQGKEQTFIRLSEPLPVHITYQTSWVDKNGILCFNNDIYGRDKRLLKVLFNE
jgi:L,D-transpeptidase YcbB